MLLRLGNGKHTNASIKLWIMTRYYLTFLTLIGCLNQVFSQFDYSFRKEQNYIVVEKVNKITKEYLSLDSVYVDDCTIIGKDFFMLAKRNLTVSVPYYIFIIHYVYEDGLKEMNRYELAPSIETIQNNYTLEGSYLQIKSKRSLNHPNIKPHGILFPYSEEEMAGEKRLLNVALNHENLLRLDEILKEFNAW